MLHGVTDNGRCWGRLADTLAKEFDVILVDQRGHGQSSAPTSGYRLDNHAADVHGLIKHLELDEPILIGHSLGACVSLRAAANHPERISRIVLIDPPLPDSPQNVDAEARYKWFSWLRDLKSKSTEDLIKQQAQATPQWSEEELYAWASSKEQVSPYIWGENGSTLDTYWRSEMKKLQDMPVQLIYGEVERGSTISPEIAEEVSSILPNAKLSKIQRAGHIVHLDQSEETIKAVLDFLHS